MNARIALCCSLSAIALGVVGCSIAKSDGEPAITPNSYQYSATASVGDFVDIIVDGATHMVTYDNKSTGQTGNARFRVTPDGSYVFASDTGTMDPVMGYEVPGFAFIMAANNTGAAGVPSILTSVHTQPISVSDLPGAYNYMQFRTGGGGMEIGDVHIDASQIIPSSYGPNGGGSPFHTSLFQLSNVQEHGSYLSMVDVDDDGNSSGNDYIFRTTDGFFAVDTPYGGLVCLQKAASKEFDPATVGNYHAMIFGKVGAQSGSGNTETPAIGTLSKFAIVVSNSGSSGSPIANLTVNDLSSASAKFSHLDFTPLDDDATLHAGIGQDCPGAFVATVGDAQYFVIFMTDSMLISSYKDNGDGTYDYWYGVGLRNVASGG
jgi:hypothetical protein